jgi:hypothetical protein
MHISRAISRRAIFARIASFCAAALRHAHSNNMARHGMKSINGGGVKKMEEWAA